MISKDNRRIQVTLEKAILEKLERLAKKDNRTVSNYLNNLVKNIEED